jgi:thioester reductase-like protein
MAYLVTGGTGFIGRFLVERLLSQHKGDIHVLVREGSEDKLKRFGRSQRIKPVSGDLTKPGLGLDEAWVAEHRGTIDHFFHLAAIYDMTASLERNQQLNTGGTTNAVDAANALEAGHLHHVSSVAAAGLYRGRFTEDMFDEGQPLEHPYHRTKFESEKVARERSTVPWRVYRPAIVLGHSETGEMDKIDGPYYFFKALKLSSKLPDLVPIVAPRLGSTNVVPVDFVVNAMVHIAHLPNLDGQAFHLVSPEPQPTVEMLNEFARVAGAPRFAAVLPRRTLKAAMRLPGSDRVLRELEIPPETIDYADFTATFDATKTTAALRGSGIAVPPLHDYADKLWAYWEANLS